MSDLINAGLFAQSVELRNITYYVVAQGVIAARSDIGFKVVLCKSGDVKAISEDDSYIIMGCDDKQHCFVPIYNRHANYVFDAINSVPTKKYLKDVNYKSVNSKTGFTKFATSCHILLDNNPVSNDDSLNLKIGFSENERIDIDSFCFIAYNGLDQRIYLSLATASIMEHKYYHFLDDLCVFCKEKLSGRYTITDIKHTASSTRIDAQSEIFFRTNITKISKISCKNLAYYEALDFLNSMIDMSRWSVAYPDDIKPTFLWHTVIIPIINMSLQQEFSIGNVRFVTDSNQDVKDFTNFITPDKKIRKCYAKIYVNEKSFHNAYKLAKSQIQQSLDFIINLARDDSINAGHSAYSSLIDRHNLDLEPIVILDNWVFIEIPFHEKRVVFDSLNLNDVNELFVSNSIIESLTHYEAIEMQLIQSIRDNKKDVISFFNSLKWVRKAWDSIEPDDKIIYSIIALEFIVNSEKAVPLIAKSIRKKIKQSISEILKSTDEEHVDYAVYEKDILDAFDRQYTDSPFMVKLDNLILRLNIPITSEYRELIKKARKMRNDVVHGRIGERLSPYDIRRLCEIISKIAFYKMRSLASEEN